MKRSIVTAFCVVITASLSFLVTGSAGSQTSVPGPETAPPDIVFNEITLTPEGVIAYDSLGNRWEYDFGEAAFVLSERRTSDYRGSDRHATEDIILPVDTRCTELRRLSDIQKSVLVGYDEYVDGNVIAYGKVTIKGWVKGNVQSYSKSVLVTESGQVDGDIKAPYIVVKDGGVVYGNEILTDPIDFSVDVFRESFSTAGIWIVFGFAMFFLLTSFLATALVPRQVENMDTCISLYRVKSLLIGLLFVFLMPMLLVILAVTIVGIILIPFLPLAYLFALTLSMIVTGTQLHRRWFTRSAEHGSGLMYQAFIGMAFYLVLWVVVSVLLGSSDEVSQGFGIFFLVVAILTSSYALLIGTGAAVLTRFGFRKYRAFHEDRAHSGGIAPAPAPPPMPNMPPVDHDFPDSSSSPQTPPPSPPDK